MYADQVTIDRIELGADPELLCATADFYEQRMGLEVAREGSLIVRLPGGELHFHAAAPAPWYHFALLVPGNRFDAAATWGTERLPVQDGDGDPVIEFPRWNAHALYFKDPLGNVVELIAHRGYQEASTAGAFRSSELRGISEIAVVSDDVDATARELHAAAGLQLWDGAAEAGIAFVGRQAHTFVLSRTGRRLLRGGLGEPYALTVGLSDDNGESVSLELANTAVARC